MEEEEEEEVEEEEEGEEEGGDDDQSNSLKLKQSPVGKRSRRIDLRTKDG